MPEACFLCLDSTEFMRNGDQFPNRFLVIQEAANLLVNAKIQMNAENTVGFLTLGGKACTVFETLTPDVDRVMTSLTKIPISGKQCHFSKGLQIASLALSHKTNPRAEKRVVAFVGTPLGETDQELDKLARKLRKDDVAVDIVAVGVESNVPRLEAFVDKVCKNGNSRFLNVIVGVHLTDALLASAILLGSDNVPGAHAPPSEFQGFGIDPSVDPELALAIRMSLEEEQQRQAAAAAVGAQSAAQGGSAQPAVPVAPITQRGAENFDDMSEEEMIARALQMSLEDTKKEGEESGSADQQQGFYQELQRELARQDENENEEDNNAEKGSEQNKKK